LILSVIPSFRQEGMSWDPAFQQAPVPPIQYLKREFTDAQKESLSGFTDVQVFYPGQTLLGITIPSEPEGHYWLNHFWKWSGQETTAERGLCSIQVEGPDGTKKDTEAYCKITHRLDPIRWIKNRYEFSKQPANPAHPKAWTRTWDKLNDPMNQAYVESLAYFSVSRLREMNLSPHFPYFYGAFSCVADTYTQNISDDYDTFRNTRWFWRGHAKNRFRFQIEWADTETDSEKLEWTRRPSYIELDDLSDSNSDTSSKASSGDESLENMPIPADADADAASLHSVDELSFDDEEESESEEDEEGSEDETPDPKIFLEFDSFPVMLMYLEKNNGVMDTLIGEITDKQDEEMWTAWIFQVIAALCAIQHTLSMTHNDLHTNNIVWSSTDEPFLYYTTRNGSVWKVPTYGKIFRIIDFGRAIFRIHDAVIYSDDFKSGNDADTQYNFGPLRNEKDLEILPNPSFDLCRLAVSLFEGLYPTAPKTKKNAEILSSEPGLVVEETVSDLFNTMWTWMLTDSNENVLVTADGAEKYPSFDLYNVITEKCHGARPRDQVDRKPFSQFRISKKKDIPKDAKFYSLFF
jgi:hypothetical protein